MRLTLIRFTKTLAAVLVLLTALPVAAQDWTTVWRDPEVVNYELTMDKIRKLVTVQRAMTALSASQPDVPAKIDADMKAMQKNRTAPATVAEAAALLDRHPSMRAIFANNGMTAREWLAISGAMSTAAVFLILEQRQSSSGSPASSLTAVQKANVALLKQNQAEWKKIEEEFRRLAAETAPATKR